MKIFTTINPYSNFESQSQAIKTWSKHYQVYSVNLKEEIEKVKSIYPDVIFLETNDTFNYNNKNLIKLNAILNYTELESGVVAIINSDISLKKDIRINIKKRYLINGIFIGTRYEIDKDKDEKYPFIYGYDIFIFNSNYSKIFKNDMYVIGMPWWDYWFPIACIKNGLNLYHIKDELIYHITHNTNYNYDIWLKFGEFLYNDIIINQLKSNDVLKLPQFYNSEKNGKLDIKKFIEYKQINVSVI